MEKVVRIIQLPPCHIILKNRKWRVNWKVVAKFFVSCHVLLTAQVTLLTFTLYDTVHAVIKRATEDYKRDDAEAVDIVAEIGEGLPLLLVRLAHKF